MKKMFIYSTCLLVLFSCGGNSETQVTPQEGEVVSAIAADNGNEATRKAELEKIKKEKLSKQLSMTTMTFDKKTIDFGKVKEDSENKAVFTVTNTGNQPLKIEKVDVSCGCTTAKKPENEIAPGMSDQIEVIFHPKVGQLKEQEKSITVFANIQEETQVLFIKAFVEEKGK
jgi:hypothetical protein